jgi:hypothetical protein
LLLDWGEQKEPLRQFLAEKQKSTKLAPMNKPAIPQAKIARLPFRRRSRQGKKREKKFSAVQAA